MNIQLYTLAKKTNSTMRPTGTGRVVGIQLKSPCSILNPTLEGATYYPENYCYIPDWGRYYFINEKTYINGAWTYDLSCDELASFKTEIGASNLYVLRSASNRNERILDMEFPLTLQSIVAGPVTGQATTDFSNWPTSFNDGVIVIGVLGDNGTGQILYQMTPNNFQIVLNSLLTTANGLQWGDLAQGAINSIMNPFQYIVSCRWYPFNYLFTTGSEINTLKAGLWECTVPCNRVTGLKAGNNGSSFEWQFEIPFHPQTSTRGHYVNAKPFTNLMVVLPNAGVIPLDTNILLDMDTVNIRGAVDPYTGFVRYYGIGVDSEGELARRLLFKKTVKFGIDIPLSNSAQPTDLTHSLAGGISVGAFTAKMAFGGGTGALASLALGLLTGSITSTVAMASEQTSGIQSTTPTSGTIADLLNPPQFIAQFYDQTEIDVVHEGRPLYENRVINTLSGFIRVLHGDVSINIGDDELSSIRQMLESGFYYE